MQFSKICLMLLNLQSGVSWWASSLLHSLVCLFFSFENYFLACFSQELEGGGEIESAYYSLKGYGEKPGY